MKKFLKSKTVWDYICLAAALLALVMLIYYCIQSNADGCFELSVPLLLGFGIVLEVAYFIIRLDFLPMVAALLFGVTFGAMLYYALPTFSDIWNNVNFIGGNADAYFAYLGILLATFIIAVVPCFLIKVKDKARESICF